MRRSVVHKHARAYFEESNYYFLEWGCIIALVLVVLGVLGVTTTCSVLPVPATTMCILASGIPCDIRILEYLHY